MAGFRTPFFVLMPLPKTSAEAPDLSVERPRRGRPPGSRNRPKDSKGRVVPPSTVAKEDYRHIDPDTLVARQLTLLDWAQQAMRNEMKRAMQGKGEWIAAIDISKLEKLSIAIVRAMEALKKSSDIAQEMAARMTPEQLLEAALQKLEGQDLATLNYAIRRLRAHRERLDPPAGFDKIRMAERLARPQDLAATGAIAELEELVEELK